MTVLDIKHLSYSYHDGDHERVIFDDTSLSFEEDTFYAVTGDSGSGKTTLLYCLAGLDERYIGDIFFEGKNLKEIGLDAYRRNCVSMIFQNYNLINYLSPLENIRIAMDISDNVKDYDESAVLGLLDHIGIDKEKARRRSSSLSGGEQQRAAIARALVTGSKVIIADEPTGNLDTTSSDEIVALFKQLAHEYGRTVIMVTHNPRLAKEADREYTIDKSVRKIKDRGEDLSSQNTSGEA